MLYTIPHYKRRVYVWSVFSMSNMIVNNTT